MENFPSNSREARAQSEPDKETPKKVIRLVDSKVVRRKKSLGTRFLESFSGSDGKSVLEYVLFDVLAPAAKDMIVDAVTEGTRRAFFGDSGSSNRRGGGYRPGSSNRGHVSYNQYSSQSSGNSYRREENRPPIGRRARGSHDIQEIILTSRREADDVVEAMNDWVERYQAISVGELYEMVGLDFNHVDAKWGWTDLRDASVTRVSEGYLLNLPRTEPLDN